MQTDTRDHHAGGAGRRRRVTEAVDEHSGDLYRFSVALSTDPRLAGTVVVEAFSRFSHDDDGSRVVSPSLRTLAASAHRGWVRRRAWPYPPDHPDSDDTVDPVTRDLRRLSDDHRAALALCMLGDHTSSQASAALGLPVPTVVTLLRESLVTLGSPVESSITS